MALAAPVVASFKWTIDAARALIRLRRENHDDFEFIPNNRHERIWRTISNQYFLIEGLPLLSLNVVGNGIVDPIPEDTEGGHILHEGE
ncbi:16312_t:CDS:2, partial [Funneliformis geosporum]